MKFGPGFAFTFFYYFVTATAIATLITAKGAHVALDSGMPQRIGLVLGLIAGVVGGYCNQTLSFSIVSTQPTRQTQQLKTLLEEMDYNLVETIDLDSDSDEQPSPKTVLCYQRPGWRSLFSGKVFLCAGQKDVTVATRRLQLQRIQHQLDQAE
ncbi:MAG: hypothetical protein VKJ64_16195 [Leptolyngbyaceae bacterium]|nr:hypothetical protein [Leptolyngbyaceae bacterium]